MINILPHKLTWNTSSFEPFEIPFAKCTTPLLVILEHHRPTTSSVSGNLDMEFENYYIKKSSVHLGNSTVSFWSLGNN